jgi:hypothetical protein
MSFAPTGAADHDKKHRRVGNVGSVLYGGHRPPSLSIAEGLVGRVRPGLADVPSGAKRKSKYPLIGHLLLESRCLSICPRTSNRKTVSATRTKDRS